jgi:hypothetical protein
LWSQLKIKLNFSKKSFFFDFGFLVFGIFNFDVKRINTQSKVVGIESTQTCVIFVLLR